LSIFQVRSLARQIAGSDFARRVGDMAADVATSGRRAVRSAVNNARR
jgi:hypothetical protein